MHRIALIENHLDPPGPVPLPEPIRARVISLAAGALSQMSQESLPASLKRVASFAPNRRATLAGTQIAAALESDEEFRRSLAVHVRAEMPDMSAALESGTPPAAANPTELAALAYLLRPAGWASVVEVASQAVSADRASAAEQRYAEQIGRLQRQLDDAAGGFKTARQRHRQEVAGLKAENAELRRKLGDARSRLKDAELAIAQARDEAAEVNEKVAVGETASQREMRRLRSRIEELEAALGDRRRAERSERVSEDMRARLLLDTLLESVQGLRRELALPTAEASPADFVQAGMTAEEPEFFGRPASLALDDPRRLDQLLALPRAHLIVDGYNVSMNAWPEFSLEQQRDRLVGGLAPLAARTAAEITVVFDAAERKQRPLVNRPRGVRVMFSPVAVIADDIIRDLVAAEPRGRPLVVVSDDQEVVGDVGRSGARTARGTALVALISRA